MDVPLNNQFNTLFSMPLRYCMARLLWSSESLSDMSCTGGRKKKEKRKYYKKKSILSVYIEIHLGLVIVSAASTRCIVL